MIIIFIVIISFTYLIFSAYVTVRINRSYYFSEKRRTLHTWITWLVPFFGALLIKGHWRRKGNYHAEVMTKGKRKNKSGSFYESGIAVDT